MDKVEIKEYQNLSEPVRVTVVTGLLNIMEGVRVPAGGKEGQNLTKKSDKDYDVYWADPDDINSIEYITLNGEEVPVEDKTAHITIDKSTVGLENIYAQLNENIIKNPEKTYLVWKGNSFPNSTKADFNAPAGSTIDWGDGTIETFETATTGVNTHTYADGYDYHLITIGGLTRIHYDAFRGCSGLTSITIGSDVTTIGDYAFVGCSSLTTMTIKSATPPTLSSLAIPTTIEKIIVPKSAIDEYKSASVWSTYTDKIVYEIDSSDLDKAIADQDEKWDNFNLQNGTGKDSIILKYSGTVDETHFGNTNTGESAVVFGEANNNTANRVLIAGKLNTNSGPNVLQSGLRNTNTAPHSIQVGESLTNKVPYSAQFGVGNSNEGQASIQGGSGNTNSGAEVIQGGSGNTNSGAEVIQGGSGNTNSGSNLIQVGYHSSNTVNYALQLGTYNKILSGAGAVQFGNSNITGAESGTNEGLFSLTQGAKNLNKGVYSLICGEQNTISSAYRSWIGGAFSSTDADITFVHGYGCIANYIAQKVFGYYNDNKANTLLEIGNGSDSSRSNAFEVLKDGRAKVYTAPIDSNDVVRVNEFCIRTTYSNLKSLITAQKLIPGANYRIIDFVTTTNLDSTTTPDYKSVGHSFDLIVVADDTKTLNCKARAVAHDGYTYFVNNDLSKWEIWYDINNDTEKYQWADSTNGKGVIYRMIDEFNNDCPYDFKNIVYKGSTLQDYSTLGIQADGYYYTFSSSYSTTTPTDYSLDKTQNVYSNKISIYLSGYARALNRIIFGGSYCNNNTFGQNCYDNTFGESCYYNTFGSDCYSNTFGSGCDYNTFGEFCLFNTFGRNCETNTFGLNCLFNTFDSNCRSNTFGFGCGSNTFGESCEYNTFGESCEGNTFGESCFSNTFSQNCGSNTFGESCSFNTFGQICDSNTFGESCRFNTFGSDCESNTFGLGCCYNTFGSGCEYNTFGYNIYIKKCIYENGCSYITININGTGSSSNNIQNIKIRQGVCGSSTKNRKVITLTASQMASTHDITFRAANAEDVILD